MLQNAPSQCGSITSEDPPFPLSLNTAWKSLPPGNLLKLQYSSSWA